MNRTARSLIDALYLHASDADAVFLQRFFKTGRGEYGAGDVFIGVRVPTTRRVCRDFKDLPLSELKKLLISPVHEHRLAATIIMSSQYKKASSAAREQLYTLYIKGLAQGHINNWDIVDTSCEHLLGRHAQTHDDAVLYDLARQGNLWQKRASIVSCFAWLRTGDVGPTLELAEILWPETHDLLQKATGWMLRETGKYVDEQLLRDFLDHHAHEMPRTCLRYAIEKLDTPLKQHYMKAKDAYERTQK